MGVKTKISLDELNSIFSTYNFTKILPTSSGIIDTTYIVYTQDKSYILKKYERDIKDKIDSDTKLLQKLKSAGLNVPICVDRQAEWFIYEKLKGKEPRHIKTFHIQELARFLAKFHSITKDKNTPQTFLEMAEILKALSFTKSNFYHYYKKLQHLKNYQQKNDGFIHSDIFKDNTLFDGTKVGVFDFIDGFYGSFYFDVAVTLLAFDAKKHKNYFINLFLNAYNQKAPKKLKKEQLIYNLHVACSFYALKRIYNYKNTSKAKELL
jgi:homoserine kinase type II